MTYSPEIPQSNVSPKDSASEIQANFNQFAAVFSSISGGVNYNHGAINTKRQGKHEVVLMEKQANPPIVNDTFTNTFCQDTTSMVDTEPQIYVTIPQFLPNNIPNLPMQLTYNKVNVAGPVYQSFLPGGYLLYFGTTNNIAAAITLLPKPMTVLFAIAPPNSNVSSTGVVITQPTGATDATIKINSNNPAGNFSWMAIAKA